MNRTFEYYADTEMAYLLKKIKFDWLCHACYQNGRFYEFTISALSRGTLVMNYNEAPDYMDQYSAPSLNIVQKYLRDRHNIQVEANQCFKSNGEPQYFVSYPKWEDGHFILNQLEDEDFNVMMFDAYEDALRAGLKYKLKEIANNENN